MQVEFLPDGIYLPDIDLWLDPREPVAQAWISHGHSDHARERHRHIWATPITLELYRLRWPEDPAVPQQLHPLAPHAVTGLNGATLTALPAAHILGAAQLRVEYRGESLVYTGDIKLRDPLCGDSTVVSPCDHLIIESTFGLPIYYFLDRDPARRRIVDYARATLHDGGTPVFFGYPLGRGQEVAHTLAAAGVPLMVHGAIASYQQVYERAGFGFPEAEPYDSRSTRGKALVVVPGMRNFLEASGRDYRLAYVSGWAALANARARVGAEYLIPYSDHAGFDELLELIARSGARHVDLVHGYTEPLARILRRRGVNAHAPGAQAARLSPEAED